MSSGDPDVLDVVSAWVADARRRTGCLTKREFKLLAVGAAALQEAGRPAQNEPRRDKTNVIVHLATERDAAVARASDLEDRLRNADASHAMSEKCDAQQIGPHACTCRNCLKYQIELLAAALKEAAADADHWRADYNVLLEAQAEEIRLRQEAETDRDEYDRQRKLYHTDMMGVREQRDSAHWALARVRAVCVAGEREADDDGSPWGGGVRWLSERVRSAMEETP